MSDLDRAQQPLSEQVAVVTGAARGIGAAIAERLAQMGASVVLTARDAAALDAVKARLASAHGEAIAVPCDLRDPRSVDRLRDTVHQLGRCDILVNNAGVGHIGKPLHEMEIASFDDTLETNLRGPFLMIRALAPLMIARKSGHIINVSSLAGRNPLPGGAAYSASKWGLNGLTYSVAEELRPYGIRVSVIAPGSVNTHFGGVGDVDAEKAARKIQPTDVAAIVAMLVSQPPQSFISEVLIRPTTKP